MNARKFAEVGLALTSLYVLASFLARLPWWLRSLARMPTPPGLEPESIALTVLLSATALLVLAFVLFRFRRGLAARIVAGPADTEAASGMGVSWEVSAYGVVFVLVGAQSLMTGVGQALQLASSARMLMSLAGTMGSGPGGSTGRFSQMWQQLSTQLGIVSLQLLLGVLVITFSPGLARWCASRARKPDLPPPEPAA